MNTRNWSIRSKIVAMVSVPIAALLALWVFATVLTTGPALRLLASQTLVDEVIRPGDLVVTELQKERQLTMVYLAGRTALPAMQEQRIRTDQVIAAFRRRVADEDLRDTADKLVNTHIDQLLTALEALPAGRAFIDRREMDRRGAFGFYNSIVDAGFRMFASVAAVPHAQLAREARALVDLSIAGEVLWRCDAMLRGAFTAGRFEPGEYQDLLQAVGAQRFQYAKAVAELPESGRVAYQKLIEGDDFVRLRAMEEKLLTEGRENAAPPINQGEWQLAYDSVHEQLRQFELGMADELAQRSRPVAIQVLLRLAVAGVLGFVAVLVAILISVRMGRSLIRRLTGLRAAALDLAGTRLPDVVDRLRRGEQVDVDAEVPVLEYGTDEIGQLGHAFSAVQRTAIRSAVEEATLRRGLREVFLNIARRSQTLLHRQLKLLDRMERRATDPEELHDLFTIDHLATRMRRHAEDLVILSGAVPGRGWRNPVPMVDVIRGAISEIEDYARVDLGSVESASLAGRAVGDVIHLLAELIENATGYSPPHTRVLVRGRLGPDGYVVEVEDRGLGMSPEAIEEANRRLAEPPAFDPANSARLGLFVVAQLGARHAIRVTLRTSPYGGITATVLIPADLVVRVVEPAVGDTPTQELRPAVDSGATIEIPRVREAPEGPVPSEAQRRMRTASRLAELPTRRPPGREAVPVDGGATPTGEAATAVGAAATGAPTSTAGDPPSARDASPEPPGGRQPQVGPAGLPRRIRQQNLAPQLRDPMPAGSPDGGSRAAALRSPQQVRSVMSALQAGTSRGRRDAAEITGAGPRPENQPEVVPGDGESTEPGRDL